MNATALQSSPVAAEPPLVTRLVEQYGATRLDESSFENAIVVPGTTVLFFTEDPQKVRETLDVAVILPEIAQAFPERLRIGVLPPALAREKAAIYGLRRWPSLVFLRDGGWLGNVEGLLDWADYLSAVNALLAGPVHPLPPKVIPVVAAGATSCG
jgi:hydrogenase-1 operon protein HyaE